MSRNKNIMMIYYLHKTFTHNLFVTLVCLKPLDEDHVLRTEELVLYNFTVAPFYIDRYCNNVKTELIVIK